MVRLTLLLSRRPSRLIVVLLAALAAVPALHAQGRGADTLRLTLGEAVARALRESPDLRLAAAQLEATEAQMGIARAGALPQVNAFGGYTRLLENARAAAIGQIFNQPLTYSANARASWTFWQGGRSFYGLRAAWHARTAAELTLTESRATVTLAVQRAYLGALLAATLVDIQSRNVALTDARVRQLEQRLASGQSSRYELLRARVQRTNAEPLLLQARADQELTLLELKRVLGLAPDRPLALVSLLDVPGVEQQVTQALVADAPADPSLRPRLRAAQLTAEASEDAIGAARADFLPQATVFYQQGALAFPITGFPPWDGQVGFAFCPPGSTPGRVCNNGGWFGDRQLGVQIQWPLFTGFRNKAGFDLARAQARQADVRAEQEAIAVATEIAAADAELARARAAFAAQRLAATEAREVFQLATLRYDRGLDTQLDVSDAQLNLLIASTNEARAGLDLWLAYADRERARGRTVPVPPVQSGAAVRTAGEGSP